MATQKETSKSSGLEKQSNSKPTGTSDIKPASDYKAGSQDPVAKDMRRSRNEAKRINDDK